jgi:hypothetical protein
MKALRKQGFGQQHSLLDYRKGMPNFGVGVHCGYLVVYYRLEFALFSVGISSIMEGVECLNLISSSTGSRGWLRKMQPLRIVRSAKALEIMLNCVQHEAYDVRPVDRVRQDPRHQEERIELSFKLIGTCIQNQVGIADPTRPKLWFEYAPRKYVYAGVHGLVQKASYRKRMRLKIGGQVYKGASDRYWQRHLRSTWMLHCAMITEGFDLKNDPDLRDVTLRRTQSLDGNAFSNYFTSQAYEDGVRFDHYHAELGNEWRILLRSIDFKCLPAEPNEALTSVAW